MAITAATDRMYLTDSLVKKFLDSNLRCESQGGQRVRYQLYYQCKKRSVLHCTLVLQVKWTTTISPFFCFAIRNNASLSTSLQLPQPFPAQASR